MVRVTLASLLLALAACPSTEGVRPCVSNDNCSLEPGGVCLPSPLGEDHCAYPDPRCPSGLAWGRLSTGIAGQCVAPVDAGPDSALPDADTDGAPVVPVVQNFPLADLVIGQAGFTSLENRGFTANSVLGTDVAATAAGIWVGDGSRILYFSPLPTVGDPNATLVVGRPSLTDGTTVGAPSASNISNVTGIAVGGGRLIVSDHFRHRVLIWNTLPSASGAPASIVLGQPSMTAQASGNGANQMAFPAGIWTDGTRLVVADSGNHRVLIWSTFPTSNGQPADLVLGQAGFGASAVPSAPTATTLNNPWSVTSDGSRLLVGDITYRRILVWPTFPTSSNAPAAFAVGQPNLTSAETVGPTADYLKSPLSMVLYRDALLVADRGNARVAIWQPFPTTSGAAASLVIGQPDLTTQSPPSMPTQQLVRGVAGLSVVGNRLYVGDDLNRRVVRFQLQ